MSKRTTHPSADPEGKRLRSDVVEAHPHALRVQHPAPHWSSDALVSGEFKRLSSDDFKGKYLVLFFYPADFTFVCPTEIIAFNDRLADFRAIGAELVAVSVDNKHAHLAWTERPRNQGGLGKADIPLVSDLEKKMSRDYQVLIEDGEDAGVALRGLFIIDPKGTLRQITVNDLPVGRNVDEVLRLVQAFQFHDKNPDLVCPANWKPGSATMKPDPEKAKDYWSKEFK